MFFAPVFPDSDQGDGSQNHDEACQVEGSEQDMEQQSGNHNRGDWFCCGQDAAGQTANDADAGLVEAEGTDGAQENNAGQHEKQMGVDRDGHRPRPTEERQDNAAQNHAPAHNG